MSAPADTEVKDPCVQEADTLEGKELTSLWVEGSMNDPSCPPGLRHQGRNIYWVKGVEKSDFSRSHLIPHVIVQLLWEKTSSEKTEKLHLNIKAPEDSEIALSNTESNTEQKWGWWSFLSKEEVMTAVDIGRCWGTSHGLVLMWVVIIKVWPSFENLLQTQFLVCVFA